MKIVRNRFFSTSHCHAANTLWFQQTFGTDNIVIARDMFDSSVCNASYSTFGGFVPRNLSIYSSRSSNCDTKGIGLVPREVVRCCRHHHRCQLKFVIESEQSLIISQEDAPRQLHWDSTMKQDRSLVAQWYKRRHQRFAYLYTQETEVPTYKGSGTLSTWKRTSFDNPVSKICSQKDLEYEKAHIIKETHYMTLTTDVRWVSIKV